MTPQEEDKRYLLAFCIPTFNRAVILQQTLKDLFPLITGKSVKVIVVDNDSPDNTREVCDQYPEITYIKNETNIGLASNLFKSLEIAKYVADYACLIGDSQQIKGDLNKVFDLLYKRDLDVLVLGRMGTQNKFFETKLYSEPNEFLREVGCVMDMIASVVLSTKAINKKLYENSRWSAFAHMIMPLNYLSTKQNPKAYFLNEVYTCQTPLFHLKLKTAWYSKTFEYFSKNWFFTITTLLNYDIESKLICIKKHDKFFPCFTPRKLLFLRGRKFVKLSDYKKYKEYMPFVTDTPLFLIRAILRIPPLFCSILLSMINHLNNFKYKLLKRFRKV
ncbi:MAG: glycosyltransferase family 2 protein [Muribaculaceae bacterium]|nr:glycosyltransferase family 2 protein [Muribaculaceae bacterium]